jgi:hypothetical protein
MNKDKALESVNEIKELMEKSSKFISVSGLAAILAGIYALAGAYIATQVITPDTYLIVALELMAIIALSVLAGRSRYCRHPVLLQIQEDRTEVFQPAHLSGIMEFFASDADRRHCVYFYPDARVL